MRTRLRLGDVEFNPTTGELTRSGNTYRLEPQPATVLAHLASRPGALVPRDELAQLLWKSDTHVNFDDGVNYAIRRIRLALGDDSRAPRFIETIPKRGYRFIAPVSQAEPADEGSLAGSASEGPSTGVADPEPKRGFIWLSTTAHRALMAAAVLVLVAVIGHLESRPNRHHELTVRVLRAVHDLVFDSDAAPAEQ